MKYLLSAAGLVFFALGAAGVLLPILPTTPFLMVSAFCFAKSSPRLERWFRSTSLYEKYLRGYVRDRAMTLKAKVTVMCTVSVIMAVSFVMMDAVPVGRVCLIVVWLAHAAFLTFKVKTLRS